MVDRNESFPIGAAAARRSTRRNFLWTAVIAGIWAAAGEWAGKRLTALRDRPIVVRVGDLAPPAIGTARSVAGGDGREALWVRLDASTAVAFDRRCPHLGCPVIWAPGRGRFECPCHRAAFDARTGDVLFGPARSGLRPAILQFDRGRERLA